MFDGLSFLITGGTGSFGTAFTYEILKYPVHSVRIFSRGEYLQWLMKKEMKDDRLRFMIGDVRDRDRLDQCMNGVDIVIHAAALKHVSVGEYNPQEFIKTNTLGAVNIVDIASKHKVSKVLGISSDKAVHSTALYGATKFTMERLFKEANRWSLPDTAFSLFRSGNFKQSHGNVFELWEEQSKNKTVTLTDEGMYRYFIDIQDAARLAIKLLQEMKGGEVFVPKMQEYSMLEILKEKYPDCEIKEIGKGQGERLHEPLFAEGEVPIDKGDYYIV